MEKVFPEVIYVAHYDHSTQESISLNACLTEKEAIETSEEQPVEIGEYKLVRRRKLSFAIKEHSDETLGMRDGRWSPMGGKWSQKTQIELSCVEQYLREEHARRAELLAWVAEALEEAFS